MNQIDISDMTEAELVDAGFRFTGTQKDPRWERLIKPGHTEYYHGPSAPEGARKRRNGSSVTRVIMSRLAYDGISRIIDQSFDGREVGAMMLCERDGDTITLIESAPDAVGDTRYENAMAVYDSRAQVMEDARLAAGIPHYAASMWHVHPSGPAKLSEPDVEAFKIRARDEIGGVFVALILGRSEGSEGFDIVNGFIVDKAGRSTQVPVELGAA